MIEKFGHPIAYCISEGYLPGLDLESRKAAIVGRARVAAECGISLFQIREKDLEAEEIFQITQRAVEASLGTGLKILVNDRTDIAIAAGAAGVHLPSNGVSVNAVRSISPSGLIVAVSTHSVEDVIAARNGGADLVVFGPVFSSPGKGAQTGLARLAEVCAAVRPFPVVALGGIDGANYKSVLRAGACGYASIRYLNSVIDEHRLARGGA